MCVDWQKAKRCCFQRIERNGFGVTPMELELRFAGADLPHSGDLAIDVMRCAKVALNCVGRTLGKPSLGDDEASSLLGTRLRDPRFLAGIARTTACAVASDPVHTDCSLSGEQKTLGRETRFGRRETLE